MPSFKPYFIVFLLVCLAQGCASSRSGQVYSRDQARTVQKVQMGTVESVRKVLIEGTKSVVGPAAGAAAGGVLGSAVGSGSGRTIATVLGAIAGGAAGAVAEEEITTRRGLELTVRLDTGEMIVVVQEADVPIREGDRVRIISGRDGVTRVSK